MRMWPILCAWLLTFASAAGFNGGRSTTDIPGSILRLASSALAPSLWGYVKICGSATTGFLSEPETKIGSGDGNRTHDLQVMSLTSYRCSTPHVSFVAQHPGLRNTISLAV